MSFFWEQSFIINLWNGHGNVLMVELCWDNHFSVVSVRSSSDLVSSHPLFYAPGTSCCWKRWRLQHQTRAPEETDKKTTDNRCHPSLDHKCYILQVNVGDIIIDVKNIYLKIYLNAYFLVITITVIGHWLATSSLSTVSHRFHIPGCIQGALFFYSLP